MHAHLWPDLSEAQLTSANCAKTLARCSGDPAVLITLLLPHGDTPDICQHQELNRDYLRGRKPESRLDEAFCRACH